jgi:hypothetical protein
LANKTVFEGDQEENAMVMPLSEQLAKMSVQAKKAEDDFAAAKKETHDKIVASREELRTAATRSRLKG